MKGLLSALAGAADQLDFIPGFDPRKDQQGMISKLMSGGQKPAGQSYQPQLDALLSQAGPTFERARQAAAGPAPMNAVQKRTAQGMPPARITPPNPADYLKSHSILDVLNPFYSTVNQDLDAAHRYRTDKANYEAQQAQMASQASDQQFLTNAQAGGFTPEQIARMNIARNHNSEEFGKNFAGNFGFNTATEGSVYSQFGNSPTKVEKTFTPVDPAKLAIDQQNANSAQLTAEAAMHRAQNPAAHTVVNNNLPSNTPPSQYSRLPDGTMIDAPPGTRPLGDGQYWVVENGRPVVRAAEGSSAAADQAAADAKTQMREENRTVGSMMSSLLTLNENKAIPSMSRGNNIPAMISQTGVGQFYDRMGSDFGGNPENAVARDQLKGLRMGALMNMISMSDVSARAMDSDAEMRAWLGAIEGDTIESALVKLHVLDSAYGTGTELDKALADGVLPQELYDYVQQQVRNDPGTRSKLEKSHVLARVDRAVANGNLTPDEAQELLALEGWAIDQNTWSNWTPGSAQ